MSNDRQAHDNLMECSARMKCTVPEPEKKVEYLINSIQCTDRNLQPSVGLVRANTKDMQECFEAACSSLIEVDLYLRSSRRAVQILTCQLMTLRLAEDLWELTFDGTLEKNL